MSALAVVSLAGCQQQGPKTHPLEATEPASPSASTTTTAPAGAVGPMTIEDPDVTESSGLAVGHLHPDVLYTHNDRGNPADIYAVDRNGTRAVLDVTVAAVDWEDIASTPDGRLWVADTGDNEETRESVELQVVDEPDVLATGSVPATTYELRYPDRPHDAEALLIDPRDMRVYLVTKDPDGGTVYAAPAVLDPDQPNVLAKVATAPPNISAGDFAPDGTSLVLRNQGRAFFYRELGDEPTVVELPSQPQGESVTYKPDGDHVLLGSEGERSSVIEVPVPELEP